MGREQLQYILTAEAFEALAVADLESETGRIDFVEDWATPPHSIDRGHAVARSVIFNQILGDEPAETASEARRLASLGLEPERVLNELMLVCADHLLEMVVSGEPMDMDAYVRDLAALPLPDPATIFEAVIDRVASEPGVSTTETIREVTDGFESGGGRTLETMVRRCLDELIGGPVAILHPNRLVYGPGFVDGLTLTHRLNDAEQATGALVASFDLRAFDRVDELVLEDGGSIEPFSVEHHHLAWAGPDGWLEPFSPGDLLAVEMRVERLTGDDEGLSRGTVAIRALEDEPEPPAEHVAAVRAAYDEIVAEPQLPVFGDEITFWLMLDRPEMFAAPTTPLSELCVAAGLDFHMGRVAHEPSVWQHERSMYRLQRLEEYDLDDESLDALAVACRALDREAPSEELRNALADCATDETLEILADLFIPHWLDPDLAEVREGFDPPGAPFEIVERSLEVARRSSEVAAAEYLAAILWERSGEPVRAEEHLRRANASQPQLGSVVERLGWYAFDRNDMRAAASWWNQLDGGHPALGIASEAAGVSAQPKLGRNEPCWCGSGRKFKQCHQGAGDLPALPDRVAWLARKTSLWLSHSAPSRDSAVQDCAIAFACGDADPDAILFVDPVDLDEGISRAARDPLIYDTALHEGGMLAHFIRERSALLPDDEQLLLASWSTVDRSVHEVVAVDPGVGFTARNLASGDVVEVRERAASKQIAVGERYCARIVPDGAGNQVVGGILPVSIGEEAAALDLCEHGTPEEICAWAGRMWIPPKIEHTPGLNERIFDFDELDTVLSDLSDDADPDAMDSALRAELQRQAQRWWLDEHVPALGGLTPREAAADPTRREDLIRLLDEFDTRNAQMGQSLPGNVSPFTYDVDWLRRELGV